MFIHNKEFYLKHCSLSISGGGMRSISALGVIKRLEELNYSIDTISGTSGGSIVALLYAYGLSVEEIKDFVLKLDKKYIFRPTFKSFFSLDYLEEQLREIIKDRILEKNIFICVTNLDTGEPEYINSGDLVKYVIASCSLIPFFKPIVINKINYADGGYTDNLPVEPIVSNFKISVNVNNIYDSNLFRKLAFILMNSNIKYSITISDLYINIDNLKDMHLFDFKKFDFAINAGYEKAKQYL